MQTHFNDSTKKVKIFFEDTEMEVEEGISVAAAVLKSHERHTRITDKTQSKRAPYCHMGICFECMMHIDGKANQQACMIQVREGMQVHRQQGMTDFTESPKNIQNMAQEEAKGEASCTCNGMS